MRHAAFKFHPRNRSKRHLGLRNLGSVLLFSGLLLASFGRPEPSVLASAPALSIANRAPMAAFSAIPARLSAPEEAITVCATGCMHSKIQPALDAAQPGDAVFVGNGVYNETLQINNSVTLVGVDPTVTIIDGGGSGPVLWIKRGVGVQVSSFTIRGGRAASGAGIYNEGSAFVANVVVENNETNDPAAGYGGGIFNYGGTMTLTDVVVQNNVAEIGAGVLNSYGGMNLARGSITNNRAIQFGGGVFNGYAASLRLDTVDLSDNRVEGSATPRGGGIYNTGFSFIERSTLTGNLSRESGGAIYQYQDTTILTNSTVSTNTADFGGSAMYINLGSMLSTNVTMADNQGGFGAIFSNDVINLRNSLVGNNSPSSCFGDITSGGHNLDSGNTCTFNQEGDLTNTNPRTLPIGFHGGPTRTIALSASSPAIDAGDPVIGCTAPDDTILTTDQRGRPRPVDGNGDGKSRCDIGAFEYFDETSQPTPTLRAPQSVPGEITVCPSGCAHQTVQAAVNAAGNGATIAVQAGTYVENVKWSGKSLTLVGAGSDYTILDGDRKGPVLEIEGAQTVTLRDLALLRGGGLVAPDADLTVEGLRVAFNSGPNAGGIYNRSKLTVRNSTIENNVSLTQGGGIHVDGGTATVVNSTIRNNTSAVDGGGIYVTGQLRIEDSALVGNGGRYGGGVGGRGAQVTILRTDLLSNRGEYGAGALFSGGHLEMQGGRVQANRADIGGGLYISGGANADGSGTITDVALLENIAEGDYGIGGAFTCNGGHCVIHGGLIRDNRATTGGALYFYKPEARVEIKDAEIAINSASLGGGIYGRAGEARIENTILRQNTATLDGGGIHADGASIRMIGGRMTNNGATRDGGAVHSGENGTVIIEGGWLANNGASRHGGALVAQKKISVVGSTLRENTADGTESLGGMALVTDAGVLEISDSLVAANTGLQGGAVAISGTLKAQNSTFSGNVALEGGAIFNAAGSAQLASLTISANRAEGGEGETAGAAGIHFASGAGNFSLRNSIVAVNPGGKDCSRTLTSGGNNIDSDGSCGLNAAGDLADQTPGLEDLADNGGPSLTHALLPASVAVDAGNAAGCMAVVTAGPIEKDQRGIARSLDGRGDGMARCDIGAYELDPEGNPPPPLDNPIYLPTLRKGE